MNLINYFPWSGHMKGKEKDSGIGKQKLGFKIIIG